MGHSRVPPAGVRGNNWREMAVTAPDQFEPELSVSVVVTYYEAPEALELTLAALEGQTYPRELFEVVIIDDGSRTPLVAPTASPLEVRVVHQEDRGFGLARARNTGARAANSEILVFLDCDMMPEAGWLAEHARWHHAANDALTLGFRAHVEVDGIDAVAVRTRAGSLTDLFADRPSDRPAWIGYHMTRTRELTSDDDDLFRVVTGGNLGISRSFFESVGGYDETFTQWGAEDTEFGYRAYTMGGLLVPARDALCWHQGAGAAPSEAESVSLKLQQAKISQLIAHHGFRKTASGRSFTVPQYVVTVQPGDADDQVATAEQVLANGIHDLMVWIAEPSVSEAMQEPGREMIRRLLGGDPRVRFGPSDGASSAIPAASFHVSIPAGSTVRSTTVSRLRRELGSAARASISLPDHETAEIVRTRALNRAMRSGISIDEHSSKSQLPRKSGRFGSLRKRKPRQSESLRKRKPKRSGILRKLGSFAAQVMREALKVRSLRDAWNLVGWFVSCVVRAAGWRIRRVMRRLYWTARRRHRALRRLARRLYWIARRQRHAPKRLSRRLYWIARRQRHAPKRLSRRLYWIARRQRHAPKRLSRRLYWIARRQRHAPKRLSRRLYWIARRQRHAPKRLSRRLYWIARPRQTDTVPTSTPIRSDDPLPSAHYRIGPETAARGRRAEAVLAVSSRVGSAIGELTEAVIVDTPETAEAIGIGADVAVVVLSESDPRTSVPAFDAESVNPVGWTIDHRGRAVALGPPEFLAQSKRTRSTASIGARAACRRAHHVMDTAAYHDDAPSRAGILAALASTGAVVHIADHNAELHHCLGSELYGLMADERIIEANEIQREAFSVAMRRSALRDHSLRARVRQLLASTGLCVPPLPQVSILLATRRPDRVAAAIDSVACQKYPRVELVLALHGDGFDRTEVARLLEGLGCPARVVEVAGHLPLGTVLNAAAAESSGTLLAKFDDDDIYGPEHLWDLVLAHEYSRAPLVGKGAEFVYLAGSDVTLHRFRGGGERYITTQSIAGGALMVTRGCFDAVLGWRPIPRSVDQALIEDVVSGGHRAYRTHGMGYVLVRHGKGHTWQADDDYFLAQAHETRPGCDLDFAGISLPASHGR